MAIISLTIFFTSYCLIHSTPVGPTSENASGVVQETTTIEPTNLNAAPIAKYIDFTGKYEFNGTYGKSISTVTSCNRGENRVYTCAIDMRTELKWWVPAKNLDCKSVRISFGPLEDDSSVNSSEEILLKERVPASIVQDKESKCLVSYMEKNGYKLKDLEMYLYPQEMAVSSEIGPVDSKMKIQSLKTL